MRPISPSNPPRLTDRDAKPPRDLERGEPLKAALAQELETLAKLQPMFHADRRHALLVVLQGRDASGKDGAIRNVFGACNPQGCHVTSFRAPNDLERSHDYLWRVHQAVPERGMIGIFNRSHYEDVLVVRVRNLAPREVWSRRYQQINEFERMLVENGTIILKFCLHISHDEQREQLLERLTDPTKNWKFNAGDLEDRALWKDYTVAYRDALRKCSTPHAPWYLVPSDNKKVRDYLITRTINQTLLSLDLRYPRAPKDVLALKDKLKKA